MTAEGLRLIETFNKIEEKLTRLSRQISNVGLEGNEELLLFTFGARISTRNVFQTVVQKVKRSGVDVELSLCCARGTIIRAVVTNEAAKELELEPGKKVLALIKAYAITVSAANKANSLCVNNILGIVTRITRAKDKCEIVLDIGDSRSLTAIVAREKLNKLTPKTGVKIRAHFNPENVIIAAN